MIKLIMCEGPNEKEIIRLLLEHGKLKFKKEDLLGLVPFHARQIDKSTQIKLYLNMYTGSEKIEVLRIGDKLSDALKIPKEYKDKINSDTIRKYCTKPKLEMLLIISENMVNEFNKDKSIISPKKFAKQNIKHNGVKYDNRTKFYTDYFGKNISVLVESIKEYKRIKKSHEKDEFYLADLLK
ncbi:GNAT family acetyltransferase [Ruminiclostridium herbifermentans]|uniref:GNAT family acetyltransferase n=1 Tax=Ruminiclostridium herbifermentans TaxID=2488810 RepID=A0A4V6YE46_9FIRM|nr:GNAT family acetyltransferase [Ruminiclostridium herbifermentans]QNU67702.1 GNAT family acetyltransferase [Ruminiclostridium herbifermentans]